ncbi:MAG TPA: hypothetical protein VGF95_01290 [Solirubrobacteraceae bacterium]|jgi:hypothetical protein
MGVLNVANASAANPRLVAGGSGGFPVVFDSGSIAKATLLETAKNGSVKCEALEFTGEVVSSTEARKIEAKFQKCRSASPSASCTTAGQAIEVIKAAPLKMKPVFINGKHGAKEERGLDFTPETAGPFAKFKCEVLGIGTEFIVGNSLASENSVIGVVAGAEVDVPLTKLATTFSQVKGTQAPKEWEEEVGAGSFAKVTDFLEAEGTKSTGIGKNFSHESAGLEGSTAVTFIGGLTLEIT